MFSINVVKRMQARLWGFGRFEFAACVVLLLISSAAKSQTARIVGLGASSCSQFTSEVLKDPDTMRVYFAWAQGYMSAILLTRPPNIDEKLDLNPSGFPLIKQIEYLQEFCDQQANADFPDAVQALYKRLRVVNPI